MKRALLLGLTLVLASCAPGATGPTPRDPGAATLTLTQGQAYQSIELNAGSLAALGARLTLTGINLAVNDPSCKTNTEKQLVCTVGDLAPGEVYLLPARGVVVAEATLTRPGGQAVYLATDGTTNN